MIIGAVVFLQLRSPTGMVGAIGRFEARRLEVAETGRERGRSSWRGVVAARDEAIGRLPSASAHFALQRLIDALLDVHRGRRKVNEVLTGSTTDFQQDDGNLVARLIYATLVDMNGTSGPTEQPSALERFNDMRAIMQGQAPARWCTLYNVEFTRAFHKVMKRYFDRPDVAVSQAMAQPHYLIDRHYEALPVVRKRLAALAEELDAAGERGSAIQCRKWVARCMVGLIEVEHDAGTRLLCADLLERAMGADSEIGSKAAKFIDAYHAKSDFAWMDLCDQSFSGRRSIAPREYRAAFLLLVAGVVFALVALGAAGILALRVLLGPLSRRLHGRGGHDARAGLSRIRIVVFSFVPTAAIALLILRGLSAHQWYAQIWVAVAMLAIFTSGGLITVLVTTLCGPRLPGRRKRHLIPLMFALGLVTLFLVMPPSSVAEVCRWLDLQVGTMWIFVPAALILLSAATILSPAPPRVAASSAAFVFLLHIALAFGGLQVHRAADRSYQRAAVAGHLDEVAARLGRGWQSKYFETAIDTYGIRRP